MLNLEAVCVRITTKSGHMYIYTLYIQPTAPIEMYRLHIEAIELMIAQSKVTDTIVVLSDFNLGSSTNWHENDSGFDYIPTIGDSQSAKSIIARELTARMLDCGLFQISNLQNSSGNVLDLVYINTPELAVLNKAEFLMLPAFKSDPSHVPLMCFIDCAPCTGNNVSFGTTYCFKKANYDSIREHLTNLNLQNLFNDDRDSVNDLTSNMYRIINETFEEFVPSTTIRSTNKPRWHNKELATLKNKRNKCFKVLHNHRNNANLNEAATDEPTHDIFEESFLIAREEYEAYRRQECESLIIRYTGGIS